MSGWIDATATFAPVYFGGTLLMYRVMIPPLPINRKAALLPAAIDWNPCLIMFNQDITYWAGAINGYSGTSANSSPMTNAWFGQGRVGVKPDCPVGYYGITFLRESRQENTVPQSDYGWEIDVTGTYKLTNNLSYMLGVGYLFTGDYYKGTSNANRFSNDYMLINKLTLTF